MTQSVQCILFHYHPSQHIAKRVVFLHYTEGSCRFSCSWKLHQTKLVRTQRTRRGGTKTRTTVIFSGLWPSSPGAGVPSDMLVSVIACSRKPETACNCRAQEFGPLLKNRSNPILFGLNLPKSKISLSSLYVPLCDACDAPPLSHDRRRNQYIQYKPLSQYCVLLRPSPSPSLCCLFLFLLPALIVLFVVRCLGPLLLFGSLWLSLPVIRLLQHLSPQAPSYQLFPRPNPSYKHVCVRL